MVDRFALRLGRIDDDNPLTRDFLILQTTCLSSHLTNASNSSLSISHCMLQSIAHLHVGSALRRTIPFASRQVQGSSWTAHPESTATWSSMR